MTPEGRTKAALKKQLAKLGHWQWWPVPSGYGKQGVDCVSCYRGHLYLIECKREGVTEPTPRQAATMREARKYGASTYLVTMNDALSVL